MKQLPRAYISEVLRTAERPAIFISFGKDSLLLNALARSVRPDITAYYFGDELTSFAAQFILDNGLTVFSYPPADRYLVPNGKGIALVDEYALNDARIPVITEIVAGENCSHGVPNARRSEFQFPHDVALWGYKQSETCDAVGIDFPREMVIGGCRFVAPLYELSDSDVIGALDEMNLPYDVEPDEIQFCDSCMNAISSGWDAQLALSSFRTRFSFSH